MEDAAASQPANQPTSQLPAGCQPASHLGLKAAKLQRKTTLKRRSSPEPIKCKAVGISLLKQKQNKPYNDEDDEILVLPHGEHKLFVDQYIFEMIVLSLPPKRIHPGVEDGSLKSEILDILEDLKPKENSNLADPRWEQLKSLKK